MASNADERKLLNNINDVLYKRKMKKVVDADPVKHSWWMDNKQYFSPEAIAAGIKSSFPYSSHVRLSEPDWIYLKTMARKSNLKPAQYLRQVLHMDRYLKLEAIMSMEESDPSVKTVIEECPISDNREQSGDTTTPLKYMKIKDDPRHKAAVKKANARRREFINGKEK